MPKLTAMVRLSAAALAAQSRCATFIVLRDKNADVEGIQTLILFAGELYPTDEILEGYLPSK